MKTADDIIDDMLVILAKPQSWIKGELALTADYRDCGPASPEAACFCMLGARRRAVSQAQEAGIYKGSSAAGVRARIAASIRVLFPSRAYPEDISIADFNDHPDTTHDDVLAVLRHARANS